MVKNWVITIAITLSFDSSKRKKNQNLWHSIINWKELKNSLKTFIKIQFL